MKKLLSKGRVIVSFVSVFAILAVSLLSMFAGVTFVASAADEAATEGEVTVTYPLNGTYDADVTILEGGISYAEVDTSVKTGTDSFTGFDTDFCIDPNTKGNGTANNPFIIETANQFAAVATGDLVDADGNVFNTKGVCFKVADNIKAFNLNNTGDGNKFSGDMTAAQVEEALKDATVTAGLDWQGKNPFNGRMDGNGVVVYGLKASKGDSAGIFPTTEASIVIRNLTVKNCYFYGTGAAVFIGKNTAPVVNGKATPTNEKFMFDNCAAYNNVVIATLLNDAITYGGILIGKTENGGGASDGDTLVANNCLVYGNSAKHSVYDITYGLVGNMHGPTSATITNSIVLDAVPHTQYYGSNAFHQSTYTNVFTNAVGKEYSNIDYVGNKDNEYKSGNQKVYTYNYAVSAVGGVDAKFTLRSYDKDGNPITASGYTADYSRNFGMGTIVSVTADGVKGSALAETLGDAWSYKEGSIPTPKVYSIREYSAGVAWSGEVALVYSGGSGTTAAPYEITTAEELALMLTTENEGKAYKLVADIVINDTTAENWTNTAKQWFTSNDIATFKGTFDANGYTVSGLYYGGNYKGDYAGLLPVVGSPASVSKLTVKNSDITGNTGAIGAAIGFIEDRGAKVIKIDAISVDDTVKISGSATKGGIIGKVGYSVTYINDCISETAGLFGDIVGGVAKVKRCISVNSYPFGNITNVSAENVYTNIDGDRLVYTNTEGDEVDGITVLTADEMKGSAAETNMAGLNIPSSWAVVEGDYPAPTGAEASAEGAVGQVWSGALASGFAGGIGTVEEPYLIETPEQLAYAIWKNNNDIHYKLTADIYLNDINSPLWAEKIGCNEWFTQRTTQSYGNFKNSTLDGDGYVIYGLFFDHTGPQSEYVRVGLIPQLAEGTVIKNIAMSEAYLDMNHDITEDCAGVFVGNVNGWNSNWPMDPKNATGNAIIRNDSEFQRLQPKIINCMADSSCYVSADQSAGGFVGSASGPILMENCTYLGSMKQSLDDYWGGTFIGNEWANGSTIIDCTSLPQTCDTVMGGNAGQTWRTGTPEFVTITWEDVYYFSTSVQRCADNGIVKIVSPSDRIGEAAKSAMPGLDWVDEYDQAYYDADTLGYTDPTTLDEEIVKEGDATTWLAIDGGTPIPSIFAKHREGEELAKLSDRNFSPPEVTVSFITNAEEVTVEDMVGRMYSKITLPVVSRDGYEFKGWHVFDDLSYLYNRDYFPPRDLQLFAEWEATGVIQNFENYTDTIWDYDSNQWRLNKPGAKGGYKNAYVRNGAKSMHLLDTNTEPVDMLLNYEDMLEPGQAYTIKFWVATDKENNPATLLTLVHNEKPVYLDTQVAAENMAVVTGLKVGEWVQYSYSFTAQTKWVSIRATGNSSLYFDDIIIGKIDGTLNGGNLIGLGSNGAGAGSLSPNTGDVVTVAALISAIMACAVVAVISKKNLVEVID